MKPEIQKSVEPELGRIFDALRDCLADRRIGQKEAEEMAGMSERYLSRLLRGRVDMKVKHLLGVLLAIGEEPGDFFARLASPPRPMVVPKIDEDALARRIQERVEGNLAAIMQGYLENGRTQEGQRPGDLEVMMESYSKALDRDKEENGSA